MISRLLPAAILAVTFAVVLAALLSFPAYVDACGRWPTKTDWRFWSWVYEGRC